MYTDGNHSLMVQHAVTEHFKERLIHVTQNTMLLLVDNVTPGAFNAFQQLRICQHDMSGRSLLVRIQG